MKHLKKRAELFLNISEICGGLAGFALFIACLDMAALVTGRNSYAAMQERPTWDPKFWLIAAFCAAIPALVAWVLHCSNHNEWVRRMKVHRAQQARPRFPRPSRAHLN